jgi:hypothetical protein
VFLKKISTFFSLFESKISFIEIILRFVEKFLAKKYIGLNFLRFGEFGDCWNYGFFGNFW